MHGAAAGLREQRTNRFAPGVLRGIGGPIAERRACRLQHLRELPFAVVFAMACELACQLQVAG